ncbi:MAG: DUF4407 domain-containing protein [Chitinophagaceae bacterium]|nr:DUF4407 domain-containing protein [Chitinophagaceae bacterium]
MKEKNIALFQRDTYVPSGFTKFLWWLSTTEKEILADAAIDRNRYSIIGMTVLATWTFATFAWTYFFFTVVNSILIAVLLGIFMGAIILTIDRALIKGITKYNKNKLLPLLFRGLLALTIGTFMAQPAVLYMFDKEIKLQTSLDNENKKMIKRQELDSLYKNSKEELLQKKSVIQNELAGKYNEVMKARENFLSETDGSGGSGKVGIKDIALAKQNEYQKIDAEYQNKLVKDELELHNIDSSLNVLETTIKKEEELFTHYLNNGFLTRTEALNNLLKSNAALQFRYYLIIFILMLIELMPVIAKTMLPSGTYDEKVLLRENMEKEIAHFNIKKEQQLNELYNTIAFENNEEVITDFFSDIKNLRREKSKRNSRKWEEEDNQTFDALWEKLKKKYWLSRKTSIFFEKY